MPIELKEEDSKYRKVKIVNEFPFAISIFFEDQQEYGTDSVLGNYLDDLGPSTTIDILAMSGHRIFATEVNGLKRIQTKVIIDSEDAYVFGEGVKKPENALKASPKTNERAEKAQAKSSSNPKQQVRTASRNKQLRPDIIHEVLPTEEPADAQEVKDLINVNAKASNLRPSLNLENTRTGGVVVLKNALGKEFTLPVTDSRRKVVQEYQEKVQQIFKMYRNTPYNNYDNLKIKLCAIVCTR